MVDYLLANSFKSSRLHPCPTVSLWASWSQGIVRSLLASFSPNLPDKSAVFPLTSRCLLNMLIWPRDLCIIVRCDFNMSQKTQTKIKWPYQENKDRYSGQCNGDIIFLPFGYKTSVSVVCILTLENTLAQQSLFCILWQAPGNVHGACHTHENIHWTCTWEHTWGMPCTWEHTGDMPCTRK